ncbi:MAG: AAA family ATPase [Prevotellaceae bacterium]|jgi:predicted AAA+ superfamily ATPase|nr:AAA family ATPase [Prevotellaceae bacterium]
MDTLFEKSYRKTDGVSLDFVRSIMADIRWDRRLTCIRGARGVGKTTLLLQYMKRNLPKNSSALYISLDNIWFSEHRLIELIDGFVKKGGKYLFADEVHKYPNWSQELKNAYDDYPELQIVFTGSSLLEILNARADLSRRAAVYQMQGLSFREYLNMSLHENFPVYSLQDILENQRDISGEILKSVKPLQHFGTYLESGYYPFTFEMKDLYYGQLEEVIGLILEIELPLLRGVDISYIPKLKQLLLAIAESAPFTPNVQKLSEHIGINRATLVSYLHYLQETRLTKHLYRDSTGMGKLQKPDKIFLENTNLAYALATGSVNTGNLRESFFFNQLAYRHRVEYPEKGDFLIDGKYTFEIGGKGKNSRQIYSLPDAYIAADDIEYGFDNKIPLWMFGFLY